MHIHTVYMLPLPSEHQNHQSLQCCVLRECLNRFLMWVELLIKEQKKMSMQQGGWKTHND